MQEIFRKVHKCLNLANNFFCDESGFCHMSAIRTLVWIILGLEKYVTVNHSVSDTLRNKIITLEVGLQYSMRYEM